MANQIVVAMGKNCVIINQGEYKMADEIDIVGWLKKQTADICAKKILWLIDKYYPNKIEEDIILNAIMYESTSDGLKRLESSILYGNPEGKI